MQRPFPQYHQNKIQNFTNGSQESSRKNYLSKMDESIETATERSLFEENLKKVQNIDPVLKKIIIHDSKNVIVKFKSL